MRRATTILSVGLAVLAVMALASTATAYESYHDPLQNDQGYCSTCHPGFGGGQNDDLHSLHTGGDDPMTNTCDLCHNGAGRDNPFTMWSVGGEQRGCAGCHGRDYGETIEADYRGFDLQGLPKSSGYGLRKHHLNSGVDTCLTCHADVDQSFIQAESIDAIYYGRDDVSLGGAPIDPCTNEDTANDADSLGLDNDGDLFYDGADDDCGMGAPMLDISGMCPGMATISATGLTPNAQIALLRSPTEGMFTVPGGSCIGTDLGLGAPSLVTLASADGNGDWTFTPNLPGGACGLFLQVLDLVSCGTTNVAMVP